MKYIDIDDNIWIIHKRDLIVPLCFPVFPSICTFSLDRQHKITLEWLKQQKNYRNIAKLSLFQEYQIQNLQEKYSFLAELIFHFFSKEINLFGDNFLEIKEIFSVCNGILSNFYTFFERGTIEFIFKRNTDKVLYYRIYDSYLNRGKNLFSQQIQRINTTLQHISNNRNSFMNLVRTISFLTSKERRTTEVGILHSRQVTQVIILNTDLSASFALDTHISKIDSIKKAYFRELDRAINRVRERMTSISGNLVNEEDEEEGLNEYLEQQKQSFLGRLNGRLSSSRNKATEIKNLLNTFINQYSEEITAIRENTLIKTTARIRVTYIKDFADRQIGATLTNRILSRYFMIVRD